MTHATRLAHLACALAISLVARTAFADDPLGVRTSSAAMTRTTTVTDEERKLLEAAFGTAAPNDTPDATPASAEDADVSTHPFSAIIQSLNPAMSFILDVAGAYYTTEEPLQIGAHDPVRTGFTFQQLELSVNASVDPYFRFDANLVFAEFGVEVEEAFGTTLSLPWSLQARFGQFLTRFGRMNPTHPHSWNFVDQPLVLGKMFGPEASRGLGLELSWLAPTPWYLELVGSATNPYLACCARSFYGASDTPIRGVEDLLYTAAVKQFFPFDDDWSLSWGLSGQFGPNATGHGNRSEIYGTDVYLRFRPVASAVRTAVSWQTEAMYRTRQVPSDRLEDFGLYSQLVYNIDLRWEVGARYEYVTGTPDDYLDPDWTQDRQRVAGQVTFYPSHFSRFRFQVNYDDPHYRPDPYWGFILSAEILVGAHGSHDF